MKDCAAETLSYFMQVMLDVPFTENDIIIEFANKKDMAKQAKILCEKYVPDKKINDSQAKQLNSTIAANALIGREKSAVIVCINYNNDKQDWRKIFFHEFMHIYCAKLEINGEHFIDIYGSGHTPDENPENVLYDGIINAGYDVWSEFIAQYFTLKKVERAYTFNEAADFILDLLGDATTKYFIESKGIFAQACAYLLACSDIEKVLSDIKNVPDYLITDSEPYSKETKASLLSCLDFLKEQLKQEYPWKISEDFIESFGSKFNTFRMMNSLYMGDINTESFTSKFL